MPQTPKNAPCPCGSGKQYKRCCINKKTESVNETVYLNSESRNKKSIAPLCLKYNSKELLKILALIQLQPLNHGKNIRLEYLVTDVINNINLIPNHVNYHQLSKDIVSQCLHHPHEDPPEDFFTDNLIFVNGNNTVYNGISSKGVEVNQGLIDAINGNKSLPKDFMQEVMCGIFFILFIHNSISKKLGHTYRLFEESNDENLMLPSVDNLIDQKESFSFSFFEIKHICDTLRIPYNTIDNFVFKWQDNKVLYDATDDNPLLVKPFVFLEEEFILVLPTAELICLNEFILNTAKKHGCENELLKLYVQQNTFDLYPVFMRMKWKAANLLLPDFNDELNRFILKQSLWQFDTDKVAYVLQMTENPYKSNANEHIENLYKDTLSIHVNTAAEKILNSGIAKQIFLIVSISKTRILNGMNFPIRTLPIIKYDLTFTSFELIVLTNNWKFDRLTLWKYAKYLHLARRKIAFAPFTTHLSIFKYYKENDESCFHSDNAPYTLFAFGCEIEGDERRKGLKKLDNIAIPIIFEGQNGFMHCMRKEEYYPVYISKEIYFGQIRNCLVKYSCPIWISAVELGDGQADVYINAILYWLNEIYFDTKQYINDFGILPISFIIELDKSFYEIKDFESIEKKDLKIEYEISTSNREVKFTLPIQIIEQISTANNVGEQFLMSFILEAVGELKTDLGVGNKLNTEEATAIIDKNIPLGNKKMVLVATDYKDIKLSVVDITDSRDIPLSDISYLLENQMKWLKNERQILSEYNSIKEKTDILNSLVALHFKYIISKIECFDAVSFLTFIMKRHETLIQKRSFRKFTYPARQACYSQYYNVFEKFSESEAELVKASLALRILIEFVACTMPKGTEQFSDDEVDILLARIEQLISYGALSDAIKYEIANPELQVLPSGRLGISREFQDGTMKSFQKDMYGREFNNYTEDFHLFFKRHPSENNANSQSDFFEKLERVFLEEWKIKFSSIYGISHLITSILLNDNKSVELIKEDAFYEIITKSSEYGQDEIGAFLKHMSFIEREDVLKSPKDYNKEEVYPWRYNRRLSYIAKPIIKVRINNKNFFLLSARHIFMAAENLLSLFFEGTLKVNKKDKKIIQLLAEQNNIKGKEYRNSVYSWMKENTSLKVFPNEIKIKPNGFFKASIDKGDIDILAVNDEKKIIYSIECKNTNQTKIAYEFHREIETYLGNEKDEGLIEKHVNRDKWLNENKKQVIKILNLNDSYQIVSLVVAKNILPLKYIKQVSLPLYSFHDIETRVFAF